ncbi:MAG: leucine-rich repeat domain-containing protein [Aeriscardovia sp.]|nr:leucine-rich repeat domain-containing protein [Aeriscardovia sp.]
MISSVTNIGKCCFRDCQQLKEIILPPRLSTIPAGCFLNCDSLNRVVLPKALTTIHTKAFWGCDLEYVEVPNNVISIDSKAFDEGVKVIVSMSKYTDLLRDAHEYNLSHNNDDF